MFGVAHGNVANNRLLSVRTAWRCKSLAKQPQLIGGAIRSPQGKVELGESKVSQEDVSGQHHRSGGRVNTSITAGGLDWDHGPNHFRPTLNRDKTKSFNVLTEVIICSES